jgi:hypothetical protein
MSTDTSPPGWDGNTRSDGARVDKLFGGSWGVVPPRGMQVAGLLTCPCCNQPMQYRYAAQTVCDLAYPLAKP